jgi:hypothetical protein
MTSFSALVRPDEREGDLDLGTVHRYHLRVALEIMLKGTPMVVLGKESQWIFLEGFPHAAVYSDRLAHCGLITPYPTLPHFFVLTKKGVALALQLRKAWDRASLIERLHIRLWG